MGFKIQGLMLDRMISAVKNGDIPAEICKAIIAGNAKSGGKLKLGKRALNQWILSFEEGESSAERLRQMIPLKVQKRSVPGVALGWAYFTVLPNFLKCDYYASLSYDIHNAQSIIVKKPTGEYICEAIVDGNGVDYMPELVREKAARHSLEARKSRKPYHVCRLCRNV